MSELYREIFELVLSYLISIIIQNSYLSYFRLILHDKNDFAEISLQKFS